MKIYYRRNLPHYQPPNATFFVTFRLADSLPANVVLRLKQEQDNPQKALTKKYSSKELKDEILKNRKRYFGKFDALLDKAQTGKRWLSDARIADLTAKSIEFLDKKDYDLLAYCVMPNHVHLVISLYKFEKPLYKILHSSNVIRHVKQIKFLADPALFGYMRIMTTLCAIKKS